MVFCRSLVLNSNAISTYKLKQLCKVSYKYKKKLDFEKEGSPQRQGIKYVKSTEDKFGLQCTFRGMVSNKIRKFFLVKYFPTTLT